MLKKLLYTIVLFIAVLTALLVTLVYLSIDDFALVNASGPLTEEDTVRMREIISANNPKAIISGNSKKITLNAGQTNQLINYGTAHFMPAMNAKVIFENGRFYLKSSYRLPENPVGKFINLSAIVKIKYAKHFDVQQLKIGNISVPVAVIKIAEPLVLQTANQYYGSAIQLWENIKRIDLYDSKVTVHYRLSRSDLKEITNIASNILVNDQTRERMFAYASELEKIVNGFSNRKQSVAPLITRMFSFAAFRTQMNNQAVEENRIALLTLGAYMVGKSPVKYISDKPFNQPKKINFTLMGRHDLAQHFLVSAGINSMSDSAWSKAIGLDKELKDSDGGSGFSFADLMADIAGNKLADKALTDATAIDLQTKLKVMMSEQEIMGDISDLPEGLTENEFRMEFGTTSSEEYIRMVREIERRLFNCTLYR